MRDASIAASYAEALYELGERQGAQAEFGAAFDSVADVLGSTPRLRAFLETPKVDPADKKRVLRESLEGLAPPLFVNFLLVVIDKRRQRLLREIARAYHTLLDERLGRLHVQVTLAREPEPRTVEIIGERLSRALDKTVVPHVRVAPEILGGVVIRYGDRVMDGSLRRRLHGMRRLMLDGRIGNQHQEPRLTGNENHGE